MPSKSLVSSWTASIISASGTHPHLAPQNAYPEKISAPRSRLPVLRHLHGLWKGVSFPRKRHMQLASEPKLRRASSTISVHEHEGAMLASRLITPTHSPICFSPTSPTTPTTPAYIPGGVDTDMPAIATIEGQAGSRFSHPFDRPSPVVPLAGPSAEPQAPLARVSRTLPGPTISVYNHRPHSIPDAATRLQDFRALIAEMRATLIHHYDFDTGGRNDDDRDDNDDDVGEDGERERVLRLLEDVMQTVRHLAEKDAAGFGRPVTEIDAVVERTP